MTESDGPLTVMVRPLFVSAGPQCAPIVHGPTWPRVAIPNPLGVVLSMWNDTAPGPASARSIHSAAAMTSTQRKRGPLTKRRLFGIDRSGPPPPQTGSDQPLNPWTIPNAIGYIRLALIPVFLIVALSSRHGHDALAAV